MGCDSTEFRFVWVIERPVNRPATNWQEIPEEIVKVRSSERVKGRVSPLSSKIPDYNEFGFLPWCTVE